MNNLIAQNSREHAWNHGPLKKSAKFSIQVPKQAHVAGERDGPLNNIHTDVLLRIEIMQEFAIQRLVRYVRITMYIGMLFLLVLSGLKIGEVMNTSKAVQTYSWVNILIAGGDAVVMIICTTCYIVRIVVVRKAGFTWSKRRKRHAILYVVQFIAQTFNSLMHFAPNLINLSVKEPSTFPVMVWLGLGRFTMWNTIFLILVLRVKMLNPWVDSKKQCIGREDAVILDAPWMHHWPLFLAWITFECITCAIFIVALQIGAEPPYLGFSKEYSGTCKIDPIIFIYMASINATMFTFQMAGLVYVYRGYCRLKEKPYNLFREMNASIRYHYITATKVGSFILFSLTALFWTRRDSCATAYLTLLGVLPPQLVMTALSVAGCIMAMPVKPGRTVTLSMKTDYLEWMETQPQPRHEVPDKVKSSTSISVRTKFCFELSVKLWYWSLAVYAFDPTTQECHDPQYPLLSFPVAMDMFGFHHHEFISEKGSDTRILVAWNDHTILVCFRGTYSATNVWSDLQFWRVVHPPKRGSYFMRSQPLVHRGFLACWQHSQLNHRIVSLVRGIMDGDKFDRSRLRVLVTGHSLGGALAVLASHELSTSCDIGSKITCYTYGAPRVGNHAFVREYNVRVPNTWQVINDVDLIPSVPKFVLLFKHVGERVIINDAGDMIVKPHAVEVSLYRMYGYFKRSNRLAYHLLLSYRASFVAICEAQYKHGKALKGGKEAMDILLKKREKLLSSGLDVDPSRLEDLHRLGSQVWMKKALSVGKEN